MYDRILELLTERSKATRAKVAAMGGNAAFKQAAGAQKDDILAKRAANAAKAAKVSRIQQQGKSQPAVHIFAGSRKQAKAAGHDLIGTTGVKGSKQPRIAEPMQGPEFPTGASSDARLSSPSRLSSPANLSSPSQLSNPSRLSSVAPMPFNRVHRRVLQGIRAAKGIKLPNKDVSIVKNAFNVGNASPDSKIQSAVSTALKKRNGQASGQSAVKKVLDGIRGSSSMHNRPSYRP